MFLSCGYTSSSCRNIRKINSQTRLVLTYISQQFTTNYGFAEDGLNPQETIQVVSLQVLN